MFLQFLIFIPTLYNYEEKIGLGMDFKLIWLRIFVFIKRLLLDEEFSTSYEYVEIGCVLPRKGDKVERREDSHILSSSQWELIVKLLKELMKDLLAFKLKRV